MGMLARLADLWNNKLKLAGQYKQTKFGNQADECWRFYTGPHNFIYDQPSGSASQHTSSFYNKGRRGKGPLFQMTYNLPAECVQLFLPVLYHRNPYRTVEPRNFDLPPDLSQILQMQMMQMMAPPMMPGPEMGMGMDPSMGGDPMMAGGDPMMGMDPSMGMDPMMGGGVPSGDPSMGLMAPPPPPPPMAGMPMDPMMGGMPMDPMMGGMGMDPTGGIGMPGMMPPPPGQSTQPPEQRLRAFLMEAALNYSPNEFDLRAHSRSAIIEALVKGRGVLWCEITSRPNGRVLPGLFYESVDNILIDPDSTSVRDAKWIARRRRKPVWEVAEMFGVPQSELMPHHKSSQKHAEDMTNPNASYDEKTSNTNDMLTYWDVYSRMGIGGKLAGAEDDMQSLEPYFGDYSYLAICEGVEYPLNLHEGVLAGSEEQIRAAVSWPIPFYEDATHPWPFVELDFHVIPNCAWPASHIGFALGELLFLDWYYSFLANKVRWSSRGMWVLPKKHAEEFRQALQSGLDQEIVELGSKDFNAKLDDIVKFFEQPGMGGDILKVGEMMQRAFERRTGMSELMYGQTASAYRSAEEASIKQSQMNVRPEDMASQVESWMTLGARKEAIAQATAMRMNDVMPIFCEKPELPLMSMMWEKLVASQDIDTLVSEFSFTIESGSIRKPNRDRERANIDESAAILLPMFQQQYQMTGDPTQLNAWIFQWAKTRDFDASQFTLPDMRMQMMMAQQQAALGQQQAGSPSQPAA